MKLILSFPGPLRLDVSISLALLLAVLQIATGTSIEFAELTFLAIVFSVIGINLAGGLGMVAGCCFAIIALKMFVVAEIAKVCFGEPGQSHLQEPLTTIGVLAVSMAALCCAALVSRPFRPNRVLFRPLTDKKSLSLLALMAFVVGTGGFLVAQFQGVSEDGAVQLGGLAGLLRRISACAPLAIVAGTAFTIVDSKGKRLFSLYNGLPFFSQLAIGILFTSKQGLFDPFFYLAVTGMAFRYPWRVSHLLGGIFVALLSLYVLFPFAQVARNYTRGVNISDTYKKTIDFLDENVRNTHYLFDQYDEYKEGVGEDDAGRYFESPNGVLERMSLIKPADSLISATLKQGTSGWETIKSGLADLLPRAILPRKYVNVPNALGYKAGFVDEDNAGTCISFGFAADAFSSFGWAGVAVISFFIGLLLIVISRLLTPAIHSNIWAVVLLGSYQLSIAEAPIGGVLQIIVYQTAWTVGTLYILYLATQFWMLLTAKPDIRDPKAETGPELEFQRSARAGSICALPNRTN
jgi:hypothetical protein